MDVYSLIHYDWNKVNVEEVENQLRFGKHSSLCFIGNGEKDAVSAFTKH